MITQAPSSLPDVDSELFEQVSDDEVALLECYRALGPEERATVLEAMVRLMASARQRAHARHAPPAQRPEAGGATILR